MSQNEFADVFSSRFPLPRQAITLLRGGQSGLSLLEVLITLSIVAILASVGLPIAEVKVAREKEIGLKYALKAMRKGIDDFREANLGPGNSESAGGRSVAPGDGVDNDGDGMIDEELKDGVDNDGDGMIDEDIVPRGYPVSLADLVRNHRMRKLFEDPTGGKWRYRPSKGSPDSWKEFSGDDFRAQPGDDIYDVRTNSPKTGLDGSRHDQW